MERTTRHTQRRTQALALLFLLGAGIGCATTSAEDRERLQRQTRARIDLGIDHMAHGRDAFALREMLQAVELSPEDAEAQLWLGEAYRRKGRLENAEPHFLKALELRKDYHAARLSLSALYLQLGRYDAAEEQAALLAADPTNPVPWRAYTNLGRAQLEQGNYQEARSSLDEALGFRRNHWKAHLNLGILEAKDGRPREALEHLRRVLEIGPRPVARAEAHYRTAELYVGMGNRMKALYHFDQAVEYAPRTTWGKQSEEYAKLLR
ncbi:MAG: tetratricopeptide repeat protein [Proteobacteria bacterium]|nr:tetratricopeptide repeat protein [Pseudomonadota bacterium]